MVTVKTQRVKDTLDELLAQVEKGEEFLIVDNHGQAVALLSSPLPTRVPGLDAGTVGIADNFDAPTALEADERHPYASVIGSIRQRQQARGHQPPTAAEVDAALETERGSWDD